MKPTQKRILTVLGLLVMTGALVFTTSCGPKKHKIDDSTVLPFKDKAELDSILDLPIMPEYTIEEYYTITDFVDGDERFVVYCKFLKEVTPEEVNKIVAQVDNGQYERWCTFDLGTENTMGIFFNHDITLAAGQKRPDILGDKIHIESQIPCRENESWKGFKVVFRNNRTDYSAVVDSDTLDNTLRRDSDDRTEGELVKTEEITQQKR